jgi:hypothetical protein
VPGDLADHLGLRCRLGGERLGGGPVQAASLTRQELGVHDLAEGRVLEPDPVVRGAAP